MANASCGLTCRVKGNCTEPAETTSGCEISFTECFIDCGSEENNKEYNICETSTSTTSGESDKKCTKYYKGSRIGTDATSSTPGDNGGNGRSSGSGGGTGSSSNNNAPSFTNNNCTVRFKNKDGTESTCNMPSLPSTTKGAGSLFLITKGGPVNKTITLTIGFDDSMSSDLRAQCIDAINYWNQKNAALGTPIVLKRGDFGHRDMIISEGKISRPPEDLVENDPPPDCAMSLRNLEGDPNYPSTDLIDFYIGRNNVVDKDQKHSCKDNNGDTKTCAHEIGHVLGFDHPLPKNVTDEYIDVMSSDFLAPEKGQKYFTLTCESLALKFRTQYGDEAYRNIFGKCTPNE